MRNPSDRRFLKIKNLHQSGEMVGKDRPVGRVTWSKTHVSASHSDHPGVGQVRYLAKGAHEVQDEIYNVRSISIDRSIGQDAATCTIVIWNNSTTSSQPEGIDTAGQRGHLTPGRGVRSHSPQTSIYADENGTRYPTSWQYPVNPLYHDAFIPNTVIRTFQGYGSDNFDLQGNDIYVHDPTSSGYVMPKDDTQLYPTGVWLIDKVTFNATDDTMTLDCRDFAKLLIEQVVYPPMIPLPRFPLVYQPAHAATGHREQIGANVATFASSSVDKKSGKNAAILGHRGSHAFDARPDTFWLSNTNTSRNNVEWLQAHTHGKINEISLATWGGQYVVYVSVYENNRWQGSLHSTVPTDNDIDQGGFFYVITSGDTLWDLAGRYYGDNFLWPVIAKANNNIIKDPHWIYPGQRIKIPYVAGTSSSPPHGNGIGASVPYVARATVPASGKVTIRLPRTFNAKYVRVTFTHLVAPHFRAGVRTMHARNHIKSTYNPGTVNKAGFIQDWSEPIKELLAWGGFTWPNATPNKADPMLGRNSVTGEPLRVWGDFERLGAGPIVPTPADYFLAKSFMEAIRQIVDFIGGIFYVDEMAGAQFRLPNIWSGGNFIDDASAPSSLGARIASHPIEFHEDANLVTYQMVLSDESVRSEILVVGGYPTTASKPAAGGYTLGFNKTTGTYSAIDFTDVLAGQYRLMAVPGESTKLFFTERECQRMAELTALFILFSYRQGSLSAPCHPGLQLDDQVRIFERTTSESNVHYVTAIKTSQDLEAGSYTMDVTTHWLGNDPNTDWFVNKTVLTPAVKSLPAILKRLGTVPTSGQVPGSTNVP